jgi:excisionase family DNA binding protein
VESEVEAGSSKATEPKFSIAKAAEIIGVHPATVSRLMNNHKLGYYQIGARRVVGQGHLEEYLSLAERRARVESIH